MCDCTFDAKAEDVINQIDVTYLATQCMLKLAQEVREVKLRLGVNQKSSSGMCIAIERQEKNALARSAPMVVGDGTLLVLTWLRGSGANVGAHDEFV